MAEILGHGREAAVTRELTKMFEETRRGTLAELAAAYADAPPPKGEIVLLVGPPGEAVIDFAHLDAALRAALETQPVKAAAQALAAEYGLPKREVYQRALGLKNAADETPTG